MKYDAASEGDSTDCLILNTMKQHEGGTQPRTHKKDTQEHAQRVYALLQNSAERPEKLLCISFMRVPVVVVVLFLWIISKYL